MLKIKPDDEVVFTKFDNGTIGGEIELLNNLLIPIAFKVIVVHTLIASILTLLLVFCASRHGMTIDK